MNITLFYSPSENQYYWAGKNICSKCNKELSNVSFLLWDFWKKSFKELIYCDLCRKEIFKAGGKYTEFKQVVLCSVSYLPTDVEACFPERPTLVNVKNVSVIDAATKNFDGERTTDLAIQSHNPHFMQMEGVKSESQLLEDANKKDEKLSLDDLSSVFDDLKSSVPLDSRFALEDEEDQKKELQDKRLKL